MAFFRRGYKVTCTAAVAAFHAKSVRYQAAASAHVKDASSNFACGWA